ncbi:cell division protein ZapA [Shimia ponticola]|uniref:cell division protein ZapA n=1 Tax=Shimia ponticola TaxID=2582893 RepID=UPI0011BF1300|nr:cell division protein ZapA [Shimia ponticola]
MPDISVTIGGREFVVACQAGEEHFLQAAAGMLDREAAAIVGSAGRIPADRMLLMAGLLLADRTAAMEDRVREAEDKLARRDALISELQDRPAPPPERVEVPVVPERVTDALAELAAQAEAVAAEVEERASA